MNIPMGGTEGPGRSAFKATEDTRHLVAQHSSQPVRGGIRYAMIGSTHTHGKEQLEVADLERFHGRDLKLVARCLGYRRGPEMVPCTVCEQAEVSGEDSFEALRHAHLGARGKTLDDLVKDHACHVFALFSDELFDPEAQQHATSRYEESSEALSKLRKAGRILEAQALLASLGGVEPRKPLVKIVGYVMPTALSGRFDTR